MKQLERPAHGGTALVLDRFVWTPRNGWVDLATDQLVTLFDVTKGAGRAAAWGDRCARLASLWHSHAAPLVDYGVLGADRRLEVYPRIAGIPGERSPAGGGFPRWAWLAHHLALHAHGVSAGRIDPARLVSIDNRIVALPDAATGWPLDEETDRAEAGLVGHAQPIHVPAGARALGLQCGECHGLALVEAVLDEMGREPVAIPFDAAGVAGLPGLAGSVARAARWRGIVPVCATWIVRQAALEVVAGRTVMLLIHGDTPPGWAARAQYLLLRHAAAIALILSATDRGDRTTAWPSRRAWSDDALRRRAIFFPALAERRAAALVRRSQGDPGRLAQAWLHKGVAAGGRRLTFDVPVVAAAVRGTSHIAHAAERAAPSTSIAYRGAGLVSPARAVRSSVELATLMPLAWREWRRGHPDRGRQLFDRALDHGHLGPDEIREAMWGVGVCALDQARLDECARWLDLARRVRGSHAGDDNRVAVGIAFALVRCRCWQGRIGDAAALLRASREHGPEDWSQLRMRARVDGALGRPDRALEWLARALVRVPTLSPGAAALHADCARVLGRLGDVVGARAHLRLAVAAGRRAGDRRSWLHVLVVALELTAASSASERGRAVARRANRLLRKSVPALVRLRAQRALEAAGWRRTYDVAAFVERWGEGALWAPMSGEEPMVNDLKAVLEICRDSDEPLPALERVCHCVRDRLQASSVAIHGSPAERGRLVLAGSTRLPTSALAQRLLDSGVPARLAPGDAGVEAGVPVTYAGRTIGAVVCRWTVDRDIDPADAEMLLVTAATALAPHLQGVLDREQTRSAAVDDTLGLLGESAVVRQLRDQVRRSASAPFHVLIEGESGSGKELVARALHTVGPRRHKRWCALNCAALTDDLLEAELFGHSRGAFTGAIGERPGLFEDADGGTLFLDEIGELSPRAQAKLLRVIQDGEVRRVGENHARRVDPRLVAATNRDLRAEAAAGHFRADLLYRLDVIRIVVAPLRDRPEDVALLARTFWADAVSRLGSRARLHPGTLAALARYHWPGNVRELQNVVMALAVNAPTRGTVPPSRLPLAIAAQDDGRVALTLDAARRSFEERFVRTAIARAGDRPGRAARELGLTRQGFRKLLVRLRINPTIVERAHGRTPSHGEAAPVVRRAGRSR